MCTGLVSHDLLHIGGPQIRLITGIHTLWPKFLRCQAWMLQSFAGNAAISCPLSVNDATASSSITDVEAERSK